MRYIYNFLLVTFEFALIAIIVIAGVGLYRPSTLSHGTMPFSVPDHPKNEAQEVITVTPKVVMDEIRLQASQYGVNVNEALAIAKCESTFNHEASSNRSTAKGVYQFTNPTWRWIKAEGHQFDYQENIKQFMINYPKHPQWWAECLPK